MKLVLYDDDGTMLSEWTNIQNIELTPVVGNEIKRFLRLKEQTERESEIHIAEQDTKKMLRHKK